MPPRPASSMPAQRVVLVEHGLGTARAVRGHLARASTNIAATPTSTSPATIHRADAYLAITILKRETVSG